MAEDLYTLGWIDLTAAAIILVFFVLGLFRGLVWQVSRVATLVLAYILAGWLGTALARAIGPWFPAETAPEVPRYIAYFLVFLVVLIALSLLAKFIHRLIQQSPLSFYNRLGGGLLGVATGWLCVIAGLTGVQMANGALQFGDGVAEAAAQSHSRSISDTMLQRTGSLLPEDWQAVTTRWREILRGSSPQNPPQRRESAGQNDDRAGESRDR